jgi:oxaloacetate decarboxylase gamma subunit
MNITELLEQGVNLMMLGMGMVFFILSLLIITLKLVSAFILKFEPEVVEASSKAAGTPQVDEDIVAAITIAVQRFRSQ